MPPAPLLWFGFRVPEPGRGLGGEVGGRRAMIFTTMRVERPEGVVVARGVAALIESAATAPTMERLDFSEARAADLVLISTTQGVPLIPWQRRDTLYDEANSDPETGQLAKYRIVAPVETYDGDHQEALCERVVGG